MKLVAFEVPSLGRVLDSLVKSLPDIPERELVRWRAEQLLDEVRYFWDAHTWRRRDR